MDVTTSMTWVPLKWDNYTPRTIIVFLRKFMINEWICVFNGIQTYPPRAQHFWTDTSACCAGLSGAANVRFVFWNHNCVTLGVSLEVVHWCRTKMLIDADWPWFFVSIYATGLSPSRSGLHHVTSIFAILLSNTPWARSVHCCSVHRSFTAAPTQRHHRLTASSFWWKRVEVCGGELHMQMWPIISDHNNKPYEYPLVN